MINRETIVVLFVAVVLGSTAYERVGAETCKSLESTHEVSPSDERLAVQFDTTGYLPSDSEFFANHACLDSSVTIDTLERRFYVYGIAAESEFDSASVELLSDTTVHRCVPVYVVLADSSEFNVTDRVEVKFRSDLTWDSATTILASHCLAFADSSSYRHNFWTAALHDSVRTSPLPYANALDSADGALWSTPSMLIGFHFADAPSDEYYLEQYYLKKRTAGTVDINIEPAWEIGTEEPYATYVRIAILDDGFDHWATTDHPDLPASRFLWPYDAFWKRLGDAHPREDTDGHGMSLAGILGAEHGTEGIAGVYPGCTIIPIVMTREGDPPGPENQSISPALLADAFYHANKKARAKVILNAWLLRSTLPIIELQTAIHWVSDTNFIEEGDVKMAEPLRMSSVVVWASGMSCFSSSWTDLAVKS